MEYFGVEIEVRIDPDELEASACGINAIVYSLNTAVTRFGVPTNQSTCEGCG